MNTNRLESIDHTVQLTHIWINELDEMLGWSDKSRSYRLLRTVLQTLRDWLPVNESADLAAQLPALLRGVYYEHWRPATTPVKQRSKTDFLARVDHAFVGDPIFYTAGRLTCALVLVFRSRMRCNHDQGRAVPGNIAGKSLFHRRQGAPIRRQG